MQTWAFPALIEKLGDDDFLATFPDIPEALTGAASLAEARENAADVLEEAILAYLAHGRPIPAPREPRGGEEAIILDPVTAARAALTTAMRASRSPMSPSRKRWKKPRGRFGVSPTGRARSKSILFYKP